MGKCWRSTTRARSIATPKSARTSTHDFRESGYIDAKVEWKRKDGGIIHVRLKGREVTAPEGGQKCAEVLVEDITERRNLERQLVQSQKFEAIGQLAGGIAHDFNNMIGAILGWADMGIEETEPESRLRRPLRQGAPASGTRRGSDAASCWLSRGGRFWNHRNIDLNNTVVETLNLLEKDSGQQYRDPREFAAAIWRIVHWADPIQMEQVVMNLCINARDAMPNGGRLIIETSNVHLDESFCGIQPLAKPGPRSGCLVANRTPELAWMPQRSTEFFRALFHDEGIREGHGSWFGDRLWDRAPA